MEISEAAYIARNRKTGQKSMALNKINSWGRILSIKGLINLSTTGYPAPLTLMPVVGSNL
tara:strand:+ start:403 stop:582 length:180 start_codon:yes stop_codon:yes gene_type:complete